MTIEEQDKLIRIVHLTMENFVDRAFSTDPVQQTEASRNPQTTKEV